jgi:iron complex outermembrane recepter protein
MRKFIYATRLTGIITFLLLAFQWAAAQTGSVKGTVKDAAGNPLSGASVTVAGRKSGTVTDANGAYMVKLPPGKYTVVVSYVGQSQQRIEVTVTDGGATEQNFTTTEVSDLNNVVVVGTRSRDARSKISTPVPVDIIRTKDIKPFAQADVSQMLTYSAPSFQSARQTVTDGTDHIDPAGLRGLGPDQTLVLVNGKRRHNTALVNINGSVGRGSVGTDLNAIPAAAIERIEVLRDGAAAQYGSDAIAGVINLVMKKSKGFTISGMAGENVTTMPYNGGTNIRDGRNTVLDLYWGTTGKNNSYLNISGQWLRRENSNRSGLDNIPLSYLGSGGALPSPPAGSGVSTIDYRRWLIDEDAKIAASRGYNRQNMIVGNSYSDNLTSFLNAGFDFTKNISFYATAGIGDRNGRAAGNYRLPNAPNQQAVLANGQRYYFDGFLPEIVPTIKDYSALTGFNIKAGKWNIDLSNTYGKNTIKFEVQNSNNASLPATDNVQTSFDAGKLSFIQNTVNADVSRRFNLSGKDYMNFAFGGEYRTEQFQIFEGERNSWVNGGRLVAAAPIAPYPGTSQFLTFASGPAVSGAQVFPGFQPTDAINAKRKVFAGYADLEFNLGKLLIGTAGRYESYDELGLNYNNLSGKLTARYEVNAKVAIRGSVSNGFRAPSLHQRYFQNTSTQFVAGLPSNSLTANNLNSIVRNAFGIKELKPETSVSYSAGITGRVGKGLTFTLDGYFIDIKNRIVLSTPFNRSNALVNTILNNGGVDASTSALQFWTNAVNTQTKGIDAVITNRFRLGSGNATIALAANVNRNTVVGGINSNSAIDSDVNNPSSRKTNPDPNANPANDLRVTLFDRQQRARIEVGQPQSKINATFTYSLKKFDILARAVRFGEVTILNNVDPGLVRTDGSYWNDVAFGADQTFSAKVTTDLVLSYRFCPGVTFSVGGNNIFDVYPDRIFVDSRNDPQSVYANPVVGANKAPGGYNTARDVSNRGRFLFGTNQFGFNGRFLFTRLILDVDKFKSCKTAEKPKVAPPAVPVVEAPKDTDGDGLLDKDDACPDVAGIKIFNGCPDTDGDGVADKEDACPQVAGPKVLGGCPDGDGDGIADKDDKCPSELGTAKYNGCPMPDKDKDGVADEADKCPDVAGNAANDGCPAIKEETIRKIAVAAQNIQFAPGSAKLLAKSYKPLNDVVDILNQYPDLKLDVEGHTDNTGVAEKNQALSQSRADAVKAYITGKGISANKLVAAGYGQDKPIADNKTAAGKAKNRRVELKLKY